MKILYMPLNKEPYEMIEAKIKPEEYREKSPYWIVRLLEWRLMPDAHTIVEKRITMEEAREIADEGLDAYRGHLVPKHYDAISFGYGYTKRRMLWESCGLTEGIGNPAWGAPDHETLIIKLGKRL